MDQALAVDVEGVVRRILAEQTSLGAKAGAIGADADLFKAGLDSVSAVNVMLAVEEAFSFEFPDASLNRATFSTVSAIADAVQKATGSC